MLDKLDKYGIKVRLGSRGDVKTICPKCSADRKHKSDPCLSVNVDEGVWNCHNCGWTGSVKEAKKEYVRPTSELKKLSQNVIDWFGTRKISNQTLLRFGVTESVEWMGGGEVNAINFNYILDGELVNIKFRDAKKNFKLVAGAMLSLYGIDIACENSSGKILITEGEIDAMSYYEAGIKYAVSVPNGASKGNLKLDWLEEMLPYITGKTVYLSTDSDEAGIALRNELARRLGRENCLIVNLPTKDANDTLRTYGTETLLDAVAKAQPFPIEGIDEVSEDDMLRLWEEGYPQGWDTGWEELDQEFQHHPGMVTLVTGIPGAGKTTFLKNVLVRLADRHDLSYLIYSAEEASVNMAMTDLISIRTGKAFFNAPGHQRITRDEVSDQMPFMKEHFKYYSLDENSSTLESIMAKTAEMVKRVGIRGLVIDNMSTVERQLGGARDSRHDAIGNMIRELRIFARKHGIHIWLIAHPKKMSKINGVYDIPTGYDVGDSSHYYNGPDVGLTIHRNRMTGQTELHRWKIRFKYCGQEGTAYFKFDLASSRYHQQNQINDGSDKKRFIGQPARDLSSLIQAGTV